MIELNKDYSYDELIIQMKRLQKAYAPVITMDSIGVTREKRVIPMFIFGSGRTNRDKKLVVTGGVHGRERINPVVLIKMAGDYCKKMVSGTLNEEERSGIIYMVPLLNPDGYEIAGREDILWKGNGQGVDINRNFPAASWKKKFTGDKPESELETAALIKLFHQVNPDGYLDYHSRGKSIFYYREAMDELYNQRQRYLGERLSQITGYALEEPTNEIDSGDSGGNTVHYFSEVFRKPAITIETVADEELFPLNSILQESTYEEIKDTAFAFLYWL